MKGIAHQEKAFSGPHTVQIDLTDKCNNSCIACWIHSPLVEKTSVSPQGLKELPFSLVEKLIHELRRLGTREIILSGSGEPFLHPNINEIIKIIKYSGFYLNIITNASALDEDAVKNLVEYKVDLLTASIWAAGPKSYTSTHPEKGEKDFEKIRNNLIRLSSYKKKYNSLKPHVKLYNVICSRNYDDIEKMTEFARVVGGDSVEFQVVDIIPGKTDFLAVKDIHKEAILKQLENIRTRRDWVAFRAPRETSLDRFIKEEFLDFGKIWKDSKDNFCVSQYSDSLICKKGYKLKDRKIISPDLHPTHETHPAVFWYKFKDIRCKTCGESVNCLDNEGLIDLKFLNILGIGSFLRRLLHSDLEKGIYEKKINSIPCYVGWYYSRILTDGSVIPCCKASDFPLGTLKKDSFSKIWNSSCYREFRFKAKNLSKNDSYFSKINCIKSCDNWGVNLEIHKQWTNFKFKKHKKNRIINIKAKDYIRANLNPKFHNFGKGLVIDGGAKPSFAEYEFHIDEPAKYEFWARYCSAETRPVDIFLDTVLVKQSGLDKVTGGWVKQFVELSKEFEVDLENGKHVLAIRAHSSIPHIEKFIFLKKKTQRLNIPETIFLKDPLSFAASKLSQYGIIRLIKKLRLQTLISTFWEFIGVFDSEYAYRGPFHVQIEPTDNCNSQCIGCWCNSPLLGDKRLKRDRKETLPSGIIKNVVDDLAKMKCREIYVSGGGEPFCHPDILDILAFIKSRNLTCHVNTNFTLLDKKIIDKLIEIGVDHLTVSIWAGTAKTYNATHPTLSADTFYKIVENLKYLNSKKTTTPYIKIYNVLFNLNYKDVEEMIKLAKETGSESVEFTLIDTIPGKTDVLLLNDSQVKELQSICERVKQRTDRNGYMDGILLFRFDSFVRRVSSKEDLKLATYDRNIIDNYFFR